MILLLLLEFETRLNLPCINHKMATHCWNNTTTYSISKEEDTKKVSSFSTLRKSEDKDVISTATAGAGCKEGRVLFIVKVIELANEIDREIGD